MKKLIRNLVIIMMISALIIGCSSKEETSNTSSKSQDSDKVEIVWLTHNLAEDIKPLIEAFEKENPNIKVKAETYPFRQLMETIEVKMGSKSTDVDVLDVDVPLLSNYTVKGYLEPMDKYVSSEEKSNWIESAVKAGSYDGKLMAPPVNTSSQVMYYNKKIFAEKGITPPLNDVNQRWTWNQVVDTAKKLTYDNNGDGQTDIFGFSFEQISRPYQILPLAQSLGAEQLDKKGIVSTGFTNSDKSIEAGQFYFDLYNTWNVSPKIPYEQAKEYFTSGKIAMFIGGTWLLKDLKAAGMDYGFAPHPYFEDGKIATPTGSWHLGISKFSKKKEAAAKFIKYVTAGEGSQVWFDTRRNVPAHKDILKQIEEDPKFKDFPDNILVLAAYEAANTAEPRPLTPGYLEWESLVNKAYEDIKNGTKPKEALDTAVQQIDRQLKKYQSVVK